jgi:hypothetical protein
MELRIRRAREGRKEKGRPYSRFLLMLKRPPLKRAPREINKIHARFFKLDAQFLAIIRCRTPFLELDRVQLHADDEFGIADPALDLGDDLEDDAAAVREGAAVGVGSLVGCGGEELCEEVAVCAMNLDSG